MWKKIVSHPKGDVFILWVPVGTNAKLQLVRESEREKNHGNGANAISQNASEKV